LLDQLSQADTAPGSSFTSIKTTTTINGKTTTSVTVSGDHAEAIEALMSGANAVPAETRAEVEDAMARGNKVEAIKLLRDATGLGLAQAKDHIDAAMDGIALDWQILQRQSVRASVPNSFQPERHHRAKSPEDKAGIYGCWCWHWLLPAFGTTSRCLETHSRQAKKAHFSGSFGSNSRLRCGRIGQLPAAT
jgi:ribosomal protein L7/L12